MLHNFVTIVLTLHKGARSATTAQSYDPAPSRSSFGQKNKGKLVALNLKKIIRHGSFRSSAVHNVSGGWRSGGVQSAMDAATNDGGLVEEYEEDLLATGMKFFLGYGCGHDTLS